MSPSGGCGKAKEDVGVDPRRWAVEAHRLGWEHYTGRLGVVAEGGDPVQIRQPVPPHS
jgi:hypothetical protein